MHFIRAVIGKSGHVYYMYTLVTGLINTLRYSREKKKQSKFNRFYILFNFQIEKYSLIIMIPASALTYFSVLYLNKLFLSNCRLPAYRVSSSCNYYTRI